ncbi:amidohydrolase family protein [bacterium]|nr:amidohydrolase family protein [bacterium]
MKHFQLKNGKIWIGDRFQRGDLEVKEGKIQAVEPYLENPQNLPEIDASHHWVCPGFMDIHVHVDDIIAGFKLADTWNSASRLALMNGITTLWSFVTQRRGSSLFKSLKQSRLRSQKHSYCDYGWHVTPVGDSESDFMDLEQMLDNGIYSLKLYTTYREVGIYSGYDRIREIAQIAKKKEIRILVHCEDDQIINELKESHPDPEMPECHPLLRSEEAEIKAVREIIHIAEETGVKFHIVHVSTDTAADLLIQSGEKCDISFETAPQYLSFDSKKLGNSNAHHFLCTPPLRHETTQKRLRKLAKKGKIPIFATDHCAFTMKDKDSFIDQWIKTPNGLAGLGALVPVISGLFPQFSEDMLGFLIRHLSENPAKMLNIFPRKGSLKPGSDADFSLIRKSDSPRTVCSSLSDSPELYDGINHNLHFSRVYSRGQLMVKDNHFVFGGMASGKELLR